MNTILLNLIPILMGIVIFGIVVLIHEFGHFIAARKCGILVEEFAIGMGPKLFGIKPGETLYSIRILPLGGFCKMLGEETSSEDKRSFNGKSVFKRIIVILAGATMNILLALVIFIFMVFVDGLNTNTIYEVSPGASAEEAGLLPGDKIVEINDNKINSIFHIYEELAISEGEPISIVVERNGSKIESILLPFKAEDGYKIGFKPVHKAGIFQNVPETLKAEGIEKAGILESIVHGYRSMNFLIKQTIHGFIQLVTFNLSIDAMSGPIGIFDVIGDEYKESVNEKVPASKIFMGMLSFLALLNIAIGIFNLFPIPALDGGRFVFLVIEAIRRKPISPETEGRVHFVGFVLLMLLALFVTYNDITKIIFS